MSLLNDIKVSLTEEQRIAITRIDAEDFSAVAKRVKKDCGFDDDRIKKGVDALKQYYVAAVVDSKNRHAISDDVDPFWHTHVMFSKEYMQFSMDVFGKYMHHEPLDHDDKERVDLVEKVYIHTRKIYETIFKAWNSELTPLVDSQRLCICCVMGSNVSPDDVLYEQGLFPRQQFMEAI